MYRPHRFLYARCTLKIVQLGSAPYVPTFALQKLIFSVKSKYAYLHQQQAKEGKVSSPPPSDVMLLVEHSPGVFTMGNRDTSAGFKISSLQSNLKDVAEETHEWLTLLNDGNSSSAVSKKPHSSFSKEGDEKRRESQEAVQSFGMLAEQYFTSSSSSSSHTEQIKQMMGKKTDQVYKLRRGGGLTWHGPGQIVMYPIMDVKQLWGTVKKKGEKSCSPSSPLRWWACLLERSVINLLKSQFGVEAFANGVGVWAYPLQSKNSQKTNQSSATNTTETMISPRLETAAEKIASVGLEVSHWVSMHGVSFNIECDCREFNKIIMCELPDKKATNVMACCCYNENEERKGGNPEFLKKIKIPAEVFSKEEEEEGRSSHPEFSSDLMQWISTEFAKSFLCNLESQGMNHHGRRKEIKEDFSPSSFLTVQKGEEGMMKEGSSNAVECSHVVDDDTVMSVEIVSVDNILQEFLPLYRQLYSSV